MVDVFSRPKREDGTEADVGGMVLYVADPSLPNAAARPARATDFRATPPGETIVFAPVSHTTGGTLVPPEGIRWTRFYLFNAGSAPVLVRVSGALGTREVLLASGGEYDERGAHYSVEVESAPIVYAAEGERA